jgi:glycerol kinase
MQKKYICALDQGTTSTRCIIFNHSSEIVSFSQKEHRQIFPSPGLVEHDASEIWENTQSVIREALRSGSIDPTEIAAIGITNQRETSLLWNKRTGHLPGNAIVWQDTRTQDLCSQLKKTGKEEMVRDITGLPLSPYFSATKIRWLLDHHAALEQKAMNDELAFGTMDSWIIWNLTGGIDGGLHATDATNASRTMLMNLQTLEWDEQLLSLFGIPHSLLPTIHPSSGIIGYTKEKGPFGAVLPIAGILGDQQAALFGQTCFEPGSSKNTYGTGCFLLMNIGEKPVRSKNGLITTVANKIGEEPAQYALEGSVAIAGALVQWIRDNLGLIRESSEINELASKTMDNGDVYIVPAFSGLYAPYWRDDARGIIVGLTRFTNKSHIARASLESTAFQTQEIITAMEEDSQAKISQLKADGGMVKSDLLMQFQSDLLDIPVLSPKITETTALGAAYAAGLAAGFWKDKEELKSQWQEGRRWTPQMGSSRRKELLARWKDAVQRTFDWKKN